MRRPKNRSTRFGERKPRPTERCYAAHESGAHDLDPRFLPALDRHEGRFTDRQLQRQRARVIGEAAHHIQAPRSTRQDDRCRNAEQLGECRLRSTGQPREQLEHCIQIRQGSAHVPGEATYFARVAPSNLAHGAPSQAQPPGTQNPDSTDSIRHHRSSDGARHRIA